MKKLIEELNLRIKSSRENIAEREKSPASTKSMTYYGDEENFTDLDDYIEAVRDNEVTPNDDDTIWEVGYINGLEEALKVIRDLKL